MIREFKALQSHNYVGSMESCAECLIRIFIMMGSGGDGVSKQSLWAKLNQSCNVTTQSTEHFLWTITILFLFLKLFIGVDNCQRHTFGHRYNRFIPRLNEERWWTLGSDRCMEIAVWRNAEKDSAMDDKVYHSPLTCWVIGGFRLRK